MKKLITILVVLLVVQTVFGQDGSFDSPYDNIESGFSVCETPNFVFEFSNRDKLIICGYEHEDSLMSSNEAYMSEFTIFIDSSNTLINWYDASQYCHIRFENDTLTILLLKYLPYGNNWEWQFTPIGTEKFFITESRLDKIPLSPYYSNVLIPQEKIDVFFKEISLLKGKGDNINLDKIEIAIGKLMVLGLNGNEKAKNILNSFESYFNLKTDGAIAEYLKEAVSTISWLKK